MVAVDEVHARLPRLLREALAPDLRACRSTSVCLWLVTARTAKQRPCHTHDAAAEHVSFRLVAISSMTWQESLALLRTLASACDPAQRRPHTNLFNPQRVNTRHTHLHVLDADARADPAHHAAGLRINLPCRMASKRERPAHLPLVLTHGL